jgi:hypothetical protein
MQLNSGTKNNRRDFLMKGGALSASLFVTGRAAHAQTGMGKASTGAEHARNR